MGDARLTRNPNDSDRSDEAPEALPFPDSSPGESEKDQASDAGSDGLLSTGDDILDAIDGMSRRIDDLARELNCLGFFDGEDGDKPRAA